MSLFAENWIALAMILGFVAVPAAAVVAIMTSSRLRELFRSKR